MLKVKNTLYGLIALAILSFSACSNYLGPGLSGTVTHPDAPVYRGKDVSANYITGSIATGSHYNEGHRNPLGSLSFHRSNTFSNGSLSYGAFGYLGNYIFENSADSLLQAEQSKSYGGLGLMFGSNVYLMGRKKVDWEALKFTARLYNELGQYPEFKRELIDIERDGRYTDLYTRHGSIVDMGLSTGIRIRHEGAAYTSMNAGFSTHLFSKRCSDGGSCIGQPFDIVTLNGQITHSFAEQISLNLLVSSNVFFNDFLWANGGYPIVNFSLSYRFGEREAK